MKARGTKKERETVIVWNDEEENATIWTASERVYRQLLKRRYKPIEDAERHAKFEVPKSEIKLPRPKRKMSEAQRVKAAERLKKNSGVAAEVVVSRPGCLDGAAAAPEKSESLPPPGWEEK